MADISPNSGDPAADVQAPSGREGAPMPPAGAVVAALAGLAGGWLAAGSTGLLAHSFRHALTWMALGTALVAAWPSRSPWWPQLAGLLGGLVLALWMTASPLEAVNVMAVAVFLAALAATRPTLPRRVIGLAALAVAVLGVYRLALTSIPFLWLRADLLARGLGRVAGLLTGQPLVVGSTFGGLDFLVAMGAFYAAWLAATPPPRRRRALWALAAILGGHLAYLVILSFGAFLRDLLPEPPVPKPYHFATDPSTWTLALAVRTLVPWNFPALDALIQLVVAGAMLRWASWPRQEERESVEDFERESAEETKRESVKALKSEGEKKEQGKRRSPVKPRGKSPIPSPSDSSTLPRSHAPTLPRSHSPALPPLLLLGAAGVLALLLPVLTTLTTGKASLEGKKIVAYREGFLNWLRARHGEYGRLSIGMYGMLPIFVRSLGGQFYVSPDLADEDLQDADVVLLLYPNKPWKDGRLEPLVFLPPLNWCFPGAFVRWRSPQLDLMWQVARRGGSILVFSDHTIREADGGNRANDVLEPTHLRILFDTAEFEVGGWLNSYQAMAHPATTGLRDDRNQFGVVIGASVHARGPARPILTGRWGWCDAGDPGSSAALLGNRRYDAGEQLGDVLVAAEQPFGRGRVIAFGDTSSITNGINMGAYVFTSRLLAYLAGGLASPQALWRGILGLLAALGLVAVLAYKPEAPRIALAAVLLSASLAYCAAASYRTTEILPDGARAMSAPSDPAEQSTPRTPPSEQAPQPPRGNKLAYIDTTHLPGRTDESERPDGVLGLKLTLMRNDYLVLDLPEFTAQRLKRAALLISVTPAREFSRAERKIVRDFVNGGGIFITTVGWEDERPSRRLLADFGLYVGYQPPASPPRGESKELATERFWPAERKWGGSDDPALAPQPLGHFKAPYFNHGDSMCFVRFHAAWPVACTETGDVKPIANGRWGPPQGGVDVPVILERDIGKGKVVLIGDSAFAMNKNLENMDGRPFEGLRENADFWRWFISYLTRPQSGWWIPPPPKAPKAGQPGLQPEPEPEPEPAPEPSEE